MRSWSALTLLPIFALSAVSDAGAEDFKFDLNAISKELGRELTDADLDALADQGRLGLQTYRIEKNGQYLRQSQIDVYKENSAYRARIPLSLILELNLNKSVQEEIVRKAMGKEFLSIDALPPGSRIDVDVNMQSANITIPQAWLSDHRQEIPNPALWDWGEPALLMSYTGDYSRNFGDDTSRRAFAFVTSRLNIGEWRLVNRSAYNYSDSVYQRESDFESQDTYLTRLIPQWKARFTAGNVSTSSVFDNSLRLFGAELRDDENQHESYERAYVPDITGVVDTRSTITIRQGGRTLLIREIPPGPYRFSNLEGLGNGGTVEVSIRGSDGTERTYYVPFMTGLKQLSAGRWSWNIASGRLDEGDGDQPYVLTAGVGYGLPAGITLFGSGLVSENYWYSQFGASSDLGWLGAVSVALEHSQSTYEAFNQQGNTIGISWRKIFPETRSQMSLSYEKTLSGSPTTLPRVAGAHNQDDLLLYADRGEKLSLALIQDLPWLRNGSLSATYIRENYELYGLRQTLNASLSMGVWYGGLLSLGLQRTKSAVVPAETYISLLLTLPLDRLTGGAVPEATQLSTQLVRTEEGWESSARVYGYIDDERSWSYALSLTEPPVGEKSYSGSLHYDGTGLRAGLTAYQQASGQSLNLSASGAVVAMKRGVFFAKDSSNSMAVVNVKDVQDFGISGRTVGSRFGDSVLVTDLMDYRRNEIQLDPDTIPGNVTISDFIETAIPADRAILDLSFRSISGVQVLFTVTDEQGGPIPFASSAMISSAEQEKLEGVFDEGGRVYFSSAPPKGQLLATWVENGKTRKCLSDYTLTTGDSITRQTLVCKRAER